MIANWRFFSNSTSNKIQHLKKQLCLFFGLFHVDAAFQHTRSTLLSTVCTPSTPLPGVHTLARELHTTVPEYYVCTRSRERESTRST